MAAESASSASAASAAAESVGLEEFASRDKRRLLHVVFRVGNLDKTIAFYTEVLGMKLLRKRDVPEEKYTNAFLGYGPEGTHFVVELTYNYGKDSYDIGTGFGGFCVAVDKAQRVVDLAKAKGARIIREPGPVRNSSKIVAIVSDPDGYRFDLIESEPRPDSFVHVSLRVGDLEKSVEFYEKAFGLQLLSKAGVPEDELSFAKMGYGDDEETTTLLDLKHSHAVTEYTKGTGYAQIAIGTDDVYKTAEAVRSFGGKITREPGPLPGINTKITAVLDPDGWKSVFVDNADFAKELA